MKKFHFNLETVLDVRQKEEDAIVRELGNAQAKLNAVLDQIAACESKILNQYEVIKQMYSRPVHMDLLLNTQNYLKSCKEEKKALHEREKTMLDEILAIKKRLSEAMKKRKILEKLKEKEYEKYRDEFNKLDDANMDEINDNKQNRRL